MKEVYLIGCHISNPEGRSYLQDLCLKLHNENKDFVISSHTMIPPECISLSKGFIYNPENFTVKMWDLQTKGIYSYLTDLFEIRSNILGHGSGLDFYGVAGLNLLRNGMDLLRRMDYEIIHWIEYDVDLVESLEKEITTKISQCDAVFIKERGSSLYMGGRISFRKSAVNPELFKKTDLEILDWMSSVNHFTEAFTHQNLIRGKSEDIVLEDINSINRNISLSEKKFEWSLYEDLGSLCLFLRNETDSYLMVHFEIDNRFFDPVVLNPSSWWINSILPIDDYKKFSIWNTEKDRIEIDISGPNYQAIVRDVIFNKK